MILDDEDENWDKNGDDEDNDGVIGTYNATYNMINKSK
jgi:hypothetical protein